MIIVAKFTDNGKLYVGKRDVKMYDSNSKISDTLIKHANSGLVLAEQRDIREKVAVKNGIKKVTSGGKAIDYSTIASV